MSRSRGMSCIPVLFNLPRVLLPVHIVFLELIIAPACPIVFEFKKEEAKVMNARPGNGTMGCLPGGRPRFSLLQVAVVGVSRRLSCLYQCTCMGLW